MKRFHVKFLCVPSRLNDYRSSKKRWDLAKLPKFEKEFYREHPNVGRRSMVRTNLVKKSPLCVSLSVSPLPPG